jgi:hypothetical protein
VPSTARGPRPRLADASSVPDRRNGDGPRHLLEFGKAGRNFSRTTPFFKGLTGALGVAVAYGLVR